MAEVSQRPIPVDFSRFPMSIEYVRGGEVVYSQTISTPGAYMPPVPDDCTLIVYYADGTEDEFPPY